MDIETKLLELEGRLRGLEALVWDTRREILQPTEAQGPLEEAASRDPSPTQSPDSPSRSR
jgi:hypothetical protein